MRNVITWILIALFTVTLLLTGGLFLLDKKDEEVSVVKEEVSEEKDTVPEKAEETKVELEGVYRMLDFDRRLILNVGPQDEYNCSIFCLAYARAILDKDYEVDPYDYYDDGAVWSRADFGDIAQDDPLPVVLQRAYDQIEEGCPVILFVGDTYAYTVNTDQQRTTTEHYVLLIGHKADADYGDLKPSDFYAIDPSGGYGYDEVKPMPWIVLTDEAPELVSGEYALYAQIAGDKYVPVCNAYPDTVAWDFESTEAIYPDRVE